MRMVGEKCTMRTMWGALTMRTTGGMIVCSLKGTGHAQCRGV